MKHPIEPVIIFNFYFCLIYAFPYLGMKDEYIIIGLVVALVLVLIYLYSGSKGKTSGQKNVMRQRTSSGRNATKMPMRKASQPPSTEELLAASITPAAKNAQYDYAQKNRLLYPSQGSYTISTVTPIVKQAGGLSHMKIWQPSESLSANSSFDNPGVIIDTPTYQEAN